MFDARTATPRPRRLALLLLLASALVVASDANADHPPGGEFVTPGDCPGALANPSYCVITDTPFEHEGYAEFTENADNPFTFQAGFTGNWNHLFQILDWDGDAEIGHPVEDDLAVGSKHFTGPHGENIPFDQDNHIYADVFPFPSANTGPLNSIIAHTTLLHADTMETEIIDIGGGLSQVWIRRTHPALPPGIPALSPSGMTVMGLSLAAAGGWSIHRRKQRSCVS